MNGIYLKNIKEVKIQLDNGWEVYYDDALYLQDPDEIDPKELSGHTDETIGLFKLNNNEFLSVSKDNTMIVWNSKGKKQTTFECVTPISGIGFINNDEIMTLMEDSSVMLFSIKKRKKLTTFNVIIDSFEKIELSSEFLLFVTSDESLAVCRYDGTIITSFKNQKEFFSAWKFFSNDYCLTKSEKGDVQLWSDSGEEIAKLEEKFSISTDLLPVDAEYFSFVNDKNEICVYDFKGQKHASSQVDLGDATRKYIKTEVKLHEQQKQNDIVDFLHLNNPVSKEPFVPSAVLDQNEIELKDEESQYLWSFFNRPIFGPIQKLLKKEEKSVKGYRKKMYEIKGKQEAEIKENEEKMQELETNIENRKRSKKRVGFITLFFLIITAVFGGITYDAKTQIIPVFYISGVLFLFFLFYGILKVRDLNYSIRRRYK